MQDDKTPLDFHILMFGTQECNELPPPINTQAVNLLVSSLLEAVRQTTRSTTTASEFPLALIETCIDKLAPMDKHCHGQIVHLTKTPASRGRPLWDLMDRQHIQ